MFKTAIVSFFIVSLLLCCKKPGPAYAAVRSNPVMQDSNNVVLPDTGVQKTYLALGDSYTIGQSVSENERFPMQVVANLRSHGVFFSKPEIIAQTGWTTGSLLYRLNNLPPLLNKYDIVTLLVGVNNQYQHRTQNEYRQQFETLLLKSVQYAGNNKQRVFVLSIPDYSVTPYASGGDVQLIARQIDSFNVINRQIAAQYNVNYLDITGFTRQAATNPSLIANDGLHPSGIEYGVWSDNLAPMIQAVLR